MTERVSVPKVTAQILFDALVQSMDFGSEFLDDEEVEALRALAVAIGVDPNTATPIEFSAKYLHPFKADLNVHRQRVTMAHDDPVKLSYGVLSEVVKRRPETDEEVIARLGGDPTDGTCVIGPYGRKCGKPENDPIHQAVEDERLSA